MADRLKTVLIILLVLLLCAQLVFSFALISVSLPLSPGDILFEASRRRQSTASSSGDTPEQAFYALPCHIGICTESGLYSPFSADDFNSAYRRTYALMDEAAGSAFDIRSSKESNYLEALKNPGILYIYDYPLPFCLFFTRFDYGNTDPFMKVCSVFAFEKSNKINLFIRTQKDGYFTLDTKTDVAALDSVCSKLNSNAVFAFETGSVRTCTPDTPLVKRGSSLPFYITVAPKYAEDNVIPREIADVFSQNPYLTSVYNDVDSAVYVDGDKVLRLYPDGRITFSASDEKSGISLGITAGKPDHERLASEAESVSKVAFSLWQKTSNEDCYLSLLEIERKDDETVYIFDGYIGGCLVERTLPACTATVKDGVITALSLCPLNFFAGENTDIIPYMQASAAAQGSNLNLHVHYIQKNSTVISPEMRALKGDAE